MDSKYLFWWRWLVVAAIGVLLFGLSLVFLPGLTQRAFNLLFFSQTSSPFDQAASAYITFVCAVMGSVMFGWSVILLYALFGPFRRGQRVGWQMVALSLAAWFIPDTSFSLWSGFWQNAVLNMGVLILFAVPLAATYRVFHRDDFLRKHI